ncbi:MAG TPA: pilus assembly protein PilP [Candidatus Binatia bacterium]|nr:pilus assembly protein PilP [Candidatus Binatia bacterium]
MMDSSIFRSVVVAWGLGMLLSGGVGAQEAKDTPSQKTREAMQKFIETPKVIRKGLEALTETAKETLRQAIGGNPAPNSKAQMDDLKVPARPMNSPEPAGVSLDANRDPFRPMTLRAKAVPGPRENLSPLERYELGQLKVTGIVWDVKEPTAMIEDSAGLGYIVKVGTPIGVNEGRIKAIGPNEIVVAEFYSDVYGTKKKRDVSLKLSRD